MEKGKRANLGLKIALAVESVLLAALVLILLLSLFLEERNMLLLESRSPDGTAMVRVYQVGSPFLFGAHTVRVGYGLLDHVMANTSFVTRIGNDGKTLDERNVRVAWDGSAALVTLHGEEQVDMCYRLEIGD